MFEIKRVYEEPAKRDGTRVLIDRLWPRGLKKEDAAVDYWMKEIAPSDTLRKWFGHKEERWQEFKSRYLKRLDHQTSLNGLLSYCRPLYFAGWKAGFSPSYRCRVYTRKRRRQRRNFPTVILQLWFWDPEVLADFINEEIINLFMPGYR